MMGKFDDVKVGDKLMVKVTLGFEVWNSLCFGKDFFVDVTVERVIKTRFTAGGVDYKKVDGCKVVENYHQSVFKAGEKISSWLDVEVPRNCQRKEMELYKKKLANLEGAFDVNPKRLRCSIDDAIKVSDLIRQIKKITDGK